ncbi:MAG: hypothetical protein CTY15_07305 [Methylocystis sp.]|nr:MAG: hypothetical protein CTY15_07305 [Methylocystis sp.]
MSESEKFKFEVSNEIFEAALKAMPSEYEIDTEDRPAIERLIFAIVGEFLKTRALEGFIKLPPDLPH